MGHFFSKVSLFIDKKEAAAHLILDQDFATAPFITSQFRILQDDELRTSYEYLCQESSYAYECS